MQGKYHFKANELLERKNSDDLGLEFTAVQRIELGSSANFETGDEEGCFVVIEGDVEFKCGPAQGKAVLKDMLYVPRNCSIELTSSKAVLMYYAAPTKMDAEFSHISFLQIDRNPETHKVFGKDENNTRRDVWHFIDTDFNCSRLMMGLCEGSIGCWTAWPPHEHADKREEVYVYFNMGKVFGIQCVYDDMDNPYTVAMVRDGDLISVPKGYHPNVSCPAGKISYIYCMVSKEEGDRNFMDFNTQKEFGEKFNV